MRARYYLADPGVFLSVDPVKNIGPGWKPEAYGYANGNPVRFADADGQLAHAIVAAVVGGVKGGVSSVVKQTASWASGGSFESDQILHGTASGIVGGAVGALNPLSGSAAGSVYDDYISALEKGESYNWQNALDSAIIGATVGYAEDKLFDSSIPKIGNKGQNYLGSIPGVKSTTLLGGFRGSNFRNGIVKDVLKTATASTDKVISNLSGNASSAANYAQNGNQKTTVTPQQPTQQNTPPSGNKGGPSGGQSQNTGVTSKPGTTTIMAGDTLSKLAQKYQTDVATLLRLNPQITNANRITAGQSLNIPNKP